MNLSEFQQKVSAAGKPVVVDFWASWCVPCRVTKPILEKLAAEYAGQVEFLAINADESRDVLGQFRVIGIPTVLALHNGDVVGRVTGAQNESGYRAMFASLAEGREVRIPLSSFDRMLRLGAGISFAIVGFSTGSWLAVALGGILAFLGVYDRCPIWRAVTMMIASRMPRHNPE
jgi:thioredoxin